MSRILIVATERLANVLDRENAALRAMDLRRATALLPEKAAAIADMEQAAPGLPHPSLAAAARRLNSVTLENRCLLERAIAAQRRVIGIVVRAAAATSVGPSYAPSGRRAQLNGPMALSTRA